MSNIERFWVILLFVSLVVSGCAGSSTDPNGNRENEDMGRGSLEDELRGEILNRAREWLPIYEGGIREQPIGYSQQIGSGLDGFRADCSGYVSYAWDLRHDASIENGGLNTYGLALYAGSTKTRIADLKPGDILIANQGEGGTNHALIFVEWADKDSMSFVAYEANGGDNYHRVLRRDNLTFENCSDFSCEIDGEGPGGRGPYAAYVHPEIVRATIESDRLLAELVPLSEIASTPAAVGIDPNEAFTWLRLAEEALDERLTEGEIFPKGLRLIGEFETPLQDFVVQSGYAYVVSESLTIIDVTNLESPELVVQFDPFDEAHQRLTRIRVVGNTAYILSEVHGVAIVDISSESSPETLAVLKHTSGSSKFNDIAVQGDFLYLLNNEGTLDASQVFTFELKLLIYDVRSPQTPSKIAEHSIQQSSYGGWKIQIVDSIAHIAGLVRPNRFKNIFIPLFLTYDTSNELNIIRLGELELENGTVNSINVRNDIAYVSGGYGMATRFLDVSDPSNPINIGYSSFPAYASETYEALPNQVDSAIYIARGAGGLRVVDIRGIRETQLDLPTDARDLLVYDVPAIRVDLLGRVIFVGERDRLLIIEQFD